MMPRARKTRRSCKESYALSACSLAGRLRGRPGFPRGPMIGGIASTSGKNWVASWALAAERRTASGKPLRSTTRGYLEPGLPRSVGFGPVCSPPFWPARSDDPRSPVTSRRRPRRRASQQRRVQALPDTRFLPVAQSAPAGRAAVTAEQLGQQPPRTTCPQHEDDASECGAIRKPRSAALRFRRLRR